MLPAILGASALVFSCTSDDAAPHLGSPTGSKDAGAGGGGPDSSVESGGSSEAGGAESGGRGGRGGRGGTGNGGTASGGASAVDGSVGGTAPDGAPAGDGSTADANDGAAALSPGYGIVYSGWPMGIDARDAVSASLDDQGRLVRYFFSPSEHLAIGGATFRSAGSDGTVLWGTWIGGPTIGSFYAGKPNGDFTFDPTSNGFHHAVGLVTTSMPTSGKAEYAVVGATNPTEIPGTAPGSFGDATLLVDFASGTVAMSLTASMPDGPATITTLGYQGVPRATEVTIFQSTFGGSSIGKFGVRGLFVGEGASHAVISYVIYPAEDVEVRGALAMKKTDTPPDF